MILSHSSGYRYLSADLRPTNRTSDLLQRRYAKSVAPSHVHDFRGAMSGRADKGITITAGTFTAEARRQATRDGVPPIELIDGEKLVDMLAQLELGLRPVTTYEVDRAFFGEFDC